MTILMNLDLPMADLCFCRQVRSDNCVNRSQLTAEAANANVPQDELDALIGLREQLGHLVTEPLNGRGHDGIHCDYLIRFTNDDPAAPLPSIDYGAVNMEQPIVWPKGRQPWPTSA